MTASIELFTFSYREEGSCWIWTGALNAGGYGRLGGMPAQRWSWLHHFGPISDGAVIYQVCGKHACVNPNHLEEISRAELARRTQRFKYLLTSPTCKNGHPVERGSIREDGRGYYECVPCRKERSARYRANNPRR